MRFRISFLPSWVTLGAVIAAAPLALPGPAEAHRREGPATPFANRSVELAELEDTPAAELIRNWTEAGPRQRTLIEDALVSRPAAAEALEGAVRTGDVSGRRLATRLLGSMRNPSSAPALIEATRDAEPSVRRSALLALSRLRAPAAAPRLRQLLSGSPNATTAKNAIMALARLDEPADIPAIKQHMLHRDPAVRVTAAGALARLGD